MIEVSFSSFFLKAYQKKVNENRKFESLFDDKIKIFLDNPFDSRLKTHKLSGKLNDIWSFSINFYTRVTFSFVDENKVIFENIGSHDNFY